LPAQLAGCSALTLALALGCVSNSPAPPPLSQLTLLAGMLSGMGNVDGTGANARFLQPSSLALDASGNLFVADSGNGAIRKMTPAGAVLTVVPDGTFGFPVGVAVDSLGNLFVADAPAGNPYGLTGHNAGNVYVVAPGTTTPVPLLGTGNNPFGRPVALAVGMNPQEQEILYVADPGQSEISLFVAASSSSGWTQAGVLAAPDGGYKSPTGVAVDSARNVYVADGAGMVWEVTPTASQAVSLPSAPDYPFSEPVGVATDGQNNLYVADAGLQGVLQYVPGTGPAGSGTTFLLAGGNPHGGSSDGTGTAARFWFQPARGALASTQGVPTASVPTTLFVADVGNCTIRSVVVASSNNQAPSAERPAATIPPANPAGGVVTTLAGTADVQGSQDGPGAQATFWFCQNLYPSPNNNNNTSQVKVQPAVDLGVSPYQQAVANVAVDAAGNSYIADTVNARIRKITPGGVVSTLAGGAGTASARAFEFPDGVAVAGDGTVYVADPPAGIISAITPAGGVSTLVQSSPMVFQPVALALDTAGNLYVATTDLVAMIPMTSSTQAGAMVTVGTSYAYPSGVAQLSLPTGLAVDRGGVVYVADTFNHTIVAFTPVTPNGGTPTWTGALLAGMFGTPGFADNAAGASASFNTPTGLAQDGSGNLYVADSGNNAIRKIVINGAAVSTAVGNADFWGTVPGPLPATLYNPMGVAVNPVTGTLVLTVPDAVLQAN
jgi:sugar lactone lactonase YvrE